MKAMPRWIGAGLLCVLVACTTTPHTPSATRSSSSPPSINSSPGPAPTKSFVPSPPADFVVADTTWVSDDVGWVLGGRGCAPRSCATILRTDDGGRHWIKLSPPSAYVLVPNGNGPQAGCPPVSCISKIRFATTSIGYAFGPSLFMTTDGGRSWRRQSPTVSVDSLEISSGLAVRVAYPHSGCPGPCDARVESSRPGTNSWHRLPPADRQGVGFATQIEGTRIYFAQYGNPAGGAGTAHTERSVQAASPG